MMLPVLIGVMVLVLIVGGCFVVMIHFRDQFSGRRNRVKGRDVVLRDANRRLSKNPRDPEALYAMADIYFEEGSWDKAMRTYNQLSEILAGSQVQGIDPFEVNLRCGLSAVKLGLNDQAYKSFSSARTYRQDNFEVNYNLGHLEFLRKNYEKAVHLLQQARHQDPDSPAVLRDLGHAFFRLKNPKEAMVFIRKAIDLAPNDKESLYTLAECYYEAKQIEQALRIFNHLRTDPVMGPRACLVAGTIHTEIRQYAAAVQDYEIGIKHQNVKSDILMDLRYRLSAAYLKQNEISKALPLLKLIQLENDSYKDVNALITKYQELNANKNLHIFLMAPSADFVALCRKIVMTYFAKAKAKVKITNISVRNNEWADILAEVDTAKWSDLVMFRFIRTQGAVGELTVRDFHSHLKEAKAGKGICVTVGSFSEGAIRYTEARLIDLIEKTRFTAILNAVDAKTTALPVKEKQADKTDK